MRRPVTAIWDWLARLDESVDNLIHKLRRRQFEKNLRAGNTWHYPETTEALRNACYRRAFLRDDGIEYWHEDKLVWRVPWNDLEAIAAWKVDIFAVDMICWGFRVKGADSFYEIDEHMVDWDETIQVVSRRFQIDPKWFNVVAFPAFVENFTVLWKDGQPASLTQNSTRFPSGS